MNTPVRSVKNQYRGINANLHSIWQASGGWSSFHGNHIADLMRTLQPLLLPKGYHAELEPSLQIRRADEPDFYHPQSDITIFDLQPDRTVRGGAALVTVEQTMPLTEALFGATIAERPYLAVKIYESAGAPSARGKPVAWIELLSPANKPPGGDAGDYFEKRLMLLETGMVFVEIDYLHETAPTLKGVPAYRARRGQKTHADAKAYQIVVLDSRTGFERGDTHRIAFAVDAPLPTVTIPLSGSDSVPMDFGIPYQKTLEETLYAYQLVDYAQLPPNFDRYDHDDQTRIVNRMLTVLRAASDGRDLEAAPLPQDELLPLDAALAQLKALTV